MVIDIKQKLTAAGGTLRSPAGSLGLFETHITRTFTVTLPSVALPKSPDGDFVKLLEFNDILLGHSYWFNLMKKNSFSSLPVFSI